MKKEIAQIKNQFQNKLQENFDADKFDRDVASGKNISSNDLGNYIKILYKGNGNLAFYVTVKNGIYSAICSNGHMINSKNPDDLNKKIAKVFKLKAMINNEEPYCRFTVYKYSEHTEKDKESFARNFIYEGVVIDGDFPKNQAFWTKMKTEYLSKKNDIKTWNRLTRFVPQKYMQQDEKFLLPLFKLHGLSR